MKKELQLITTRVVEMNLGKASDDNLDKEFSLGYAIHFPKLDDEKLNRFCIIFKFETNTDTEEGSFLSVKFLAEFEASWNIDDEFKKSNFPKINAPAIAFPFLRSFISTFLVSAETYYSSEYKFCGLSKRCRK